MLTHRLGSLIHVCLALGLLVTSSPILSAAPDDPRPENGAASAASASSARDDDDAVLDPAEPDFRLVNLPTTMRLPRLKGDFALTHRFAGNLRRGSFSDNAGHLFGIDDGATVGFEYRFGIARHLQAVAYRVSFQQTLQLYAKYDAAHQTRTMPVSLSALISDEAVNNFQDDHAPALGLSVSRTLAQAIAVYVVPTWVHNSAAATGIDRNTLFVGVGGRVRIRPTVYVAADVSPRVSGYAPGTSQFGVALEKRAGGHLFQLNLTNSPGTTFAQVARGGVPQSLSLGFNLSRKFF